MKQLPLFPKWLILLIDMRLGNLERHILIRDLGDIRDEEYPRETEDEDPDRQVDPLHALQGGDAVVCRGEEGVGAEDGADDGADGVEGLREVDADFGVAGWAADCVRLVRYNRYARMEEAGRSRAGSCKE